MRAFVILLLPLAYAGILRPKADYQQFIISGSDALISDYPWQLSLRTTGHICGASLVRHNAAVTAAHCVDVAGRTYNIRGGVTDKNSNAGFDRSAVTVTLHADFVNDGNVGFPNDIATLKWAAAVALNANVQLITLADAGIGGIAYENDDCVITGWGKTVGCAINCPPTPAILQMAPTQIITKVQCTVGINTWSSTQINDGQVCLRNGETSACQGDSGGPLVCAPAGTTNYVLVGATSWGSALCNVNYPSVYTSVPYFRSWIEANL